MTKGVRQIIARINRACFFARYSWRFRQLNLGASFISPFRVDGFSGIELGKNAFFQRGAWLYCCGVDGVDASLKIGEGCVFGYNNHITAVRKVVIGQHVLTANNVYISDNLHGFEDTETPIMFQPVRFKSEVSIGDGSWIGENACIIGARIGKNCVIGANSVVTHDIPDYSVAVGVPAIVIKQFDLKLRQWINKKQSQSHRSEE